MWIDRRAEAQCTWLREHVGQAAITAVNGGRVDPYYLAPKLIWLRDHLPISTGVVTRRTASQRRDRRVN